MQIKRQIRTGCARGFLLAILFSSLTSNAEELSVRGEPVSKSDIASLNPVCRLIMENYGIHHTVGQTKNAALFERPEYQMAKGNTHLHHYCWALISKQRYLRSHTQVKRDFYFDQAMGDIGYVFKHTDKSWPHFDVLFLEQASMNMLRGNYPVAIQKADEALRSKPGTEKAYIIKSDSYKEMGKKDMAIKIAQEGLGENPESRALRRRLVQLGITPPEISQMPAKTVAPVTGKVVHEVPKIENEPDKTTDNRNETGQTNAVSREANEAGQGEFPTAPSDAPTGQDDSPLKNPKVESPNIPKDNPYCRFCP